MHSKLQPHRQLGDCIMQINIIVGRGVILCVYRGWFSFTRMFGWLRPCFIKLWRVCHFVGWTASCFSFVCCFCSAPANWGFDCSPLVVKSYLIITTHSKHTEWSLWGRWDRVICVGRKRFHSSRVWNYTACFFIYSIQMYSYCKGRIYLCLKSSS